MCKVEGCNNFIFCRDYCREHYLQFNKYGKITNQQVKQRTDNKCAIDGCNMSKRSGNYCCFHNFRLSKYGSPTARVCGDKNDYSIDEGICCINLYNDKAVKIASTIIDDCFAEKVLKHIWYLAADGYPTTRVKRRLYKLHKFILDDLDNKSTFDHIDRDKLNNKLSNLREATTQQNSHNTSVRDISKSGYKGVFLMKDGYYLSQITCGSKTHTIGRFKDLRTAIIAYNKKSEEIHGEFGFRNEVPENLQ